MEKMTSEQDALDALQAIVDGLYDFNLDLLETVFDSAAEVLEGLGVLDGYDEDQDSLLQRACNRITEVLIKLHASQLE